MKKIILFCLIGSSVLAAAYITHWEPKDYAIKFSTRMAKGSIAGLKGTIDFDPNRLAASKFDVSVDLNTLDMGLGLKTKHAKAENFFHAEKYPTLYFKSDEIVRQGDQYSCSGILTIKGISKPVIIPFTFNQEGEKATFNGKFTINRKDYNLNRKGVGEIVEIELNIPVVK
jgi:polyisoprenoid-binding protein YceI